jgi:hypothetical protein
LKCLALKPTHRVHVNHGEKILGLKSARWIVDEMCRTNSIGR